MISAFTDCGDLKRTVLCEMHWAACGHNRSFDTSIQIVDDRYIRLFRCDPA
jgi:hypothetical protein